MIAATESQMLLALANLAVCTGVGWACVTRFTAMRASTTAPIWRFRYAALLTAATASGWSPILFGEWPGLIQVVISLVFLSIIGFGGAWADGVPSYARRKSEISRSHA